MITNRIETPFGTFSRKSKTAYSFAAVIEAAVDPGNGLRVVGSRKGDPALSDGERYRATQRVRYLAVWSRSEANARKNGETYAWDLTRVLGVFPVEAK